MASPTDVDIVAALVLGATVFATFPELSTRTYNRFVPK
jgi:hypothetical protein